MIYSSKNIREIKQYENRGLTAVSGPMKQPVSFNNTVLVLLYIFLN